jgi:hypothetical protein
MKAEQMRDAAFKIFQQVGNPLIRTSKGQQWIVQTKDGIRAILKTAAKGGLMVKTAAPDTAAPIIGFDADVTHILAAVFDGQTVTAYLVPIDVAEAAYRRNNREWLDIDPSHKQSTTWVLRFPENPNAKYFGHNMATVWAEYAAGSIDLQAPPVEPKDVLERSRADIAAAYGVEPEQVRISVDL